MIKKERENFITDPKEFSFFINQVERGS